MSNDAKETICFGHFRDGLIHGEAWEIPKEAYNSAKEAIKDWSFEEIDENDAD